MTEIDPFVKIKIDNDKQLNKAKTILSLVKEKVPNIIEPIIELTDDDTIQLAWDNRICYADIDIYPDLKLEWFFADRENRWSAAMKPRETNELHESLVEKLMFFLKEENKVEEKIEEKVEEVIEKVAVEELIEEIKEIQEEIKVEEKTKVEQPKKKKTKRTKKK